MPHFLLVLSWVVVTQGSVPWFIVAISAFCILLSYSVFRVSGILLVWGIVFKIEFFIVSFVSQFGSDQSGLYGIVMQAKLSSYVTDHD